MNCREKTDAAVLQAVAKWETAPMHIKAMAGVYVSPLFEAVKAINEELDELRQEQARSSCV